ncbi:MAG: hypothetical protein KI790_07325 [Cyclobacteriaceae bacterium]|nr:hypothetical protein [Cyclobacteriaceae bacterium HetDA_MAG_MS6]
MARIDLNTPYEDFLRSQVKSGLFSSITAAAEHAIRVQMIEQEKLRVSSITAAIAKGEADISVGKTVSYSSKLMSEISQKGKEKSFAGISVKGDVKP